MKYLLILLLFPFIAPCQTVHINDDKIEYDGTMAVSSLSNIELTKRVQKAIAIIGHEKRSTLLPSGTNDSKYAGTIRLKTPYPLVRTFSYTLSLVPEVGGLKYKIDDIEVHETKRGEETKTTKGKDIIEGLESSGVVASNTERLLNEIDMNLQKILAIIKAQLHSN